MLRTLQTESGKPFQFEIIDGSTIIVYPTDKNGHPQIRTVVPITPFVIAQVEAIIAARGRVLIGPSRDAPLRDSLGEWLTADHKSPQLLSYLVPILVEQGFCTIVGHRPASVRYRKGS